MKINWMMFVIGAWVAVGGIAMFISILPKAIEDWHIGGAVPFMITVTIWLLFAVVAMGIYLMGISVKHK